MFIVTIITVLLVFIIAFAVVVKRHQRLANIAFFMSLLSTAAVIFGDTMSVINPRSVMEWKRIVFISESIMASSWLLFTMSFARTNYWRTINKFSRFLLCLSPLYIILFLTVPMEDFFYSPEFERERVLFLGNAGYIFNLSLLIYSIVSILNLEAILKGSSGRHRWQIKYTMLGVGGVLAISIFYYSHALLYRSINMNLHPVRTGIIFISLVLIGISLLKHKVMEVKFTISRKAFYRSISLFIVGFYLLGLGVIGQGMRYFSPRIGENITIFLGFVGAFLVLTILLSEQLRRKAIVFINKNFYSQKYDYREEWLKFTQRVSLRHSFEELLGSIIEGFKDAMGARGAAIWLQKKGSEEYYCAKVLDAEMVEIGPNHELTDFLKNKKWIFNINDINCKTLASQSENFITSTGASLIIPLLNVNTLIGFVILREALADSEYNYEDYDLLKTLARQTTLAILNANLLEELTEAKEMEVIGRISSFILHDLKNATSMLSLIVQNAEEHIDNPDFQKDAIRAVSNTSEKIQGIIEKLTNVPSKTNLDLQESDLGGCVKSAFRELQLNGDSRVHYTEKKRVRANLDQKEIAKVIINLIMNALDATSNQGDIAVEVGAEETMGFVRVSDNGCGMSSEFMEKHLFKPFQTTKKKGLGIGLYQCKTIVEAHSGKMKVVSQEGKGTDFLIYLPMVS